jgi:hypothetical protein
MGVLTLGVSWLRITARWVHDSGLLFSMFGNNVGVLRWSSGFGDTSYDSDESWGNSSEGWFGIGRLRLVLAVATSCEEDGGYVFMLKRGRWGTVL